MTRVERETPTKANAVFIVVAMLAFQVGVRDPAGATK